MGKGKEVEEEEEEEPVEDKLAALKVEEPATVTEDPFKDVPVLSRTAAELYLFDTETDVFVIQEKAVDVDMASNGDFESKLVFWRHATPGIADSHPAWIIVRQKDTPFISVPIDEELNPRFDMANAAFMFTFREREGLPAMTWCLRFEQSVFGPWKDNFTIYMWEGKNRMSYAKAKADEQRYIQDAYDDRDIEMGEPEDEVEEEEEEEETPSEASEVPEDDDDDSSETKAFRKGAKNEQLAVGYKNDLSFVGRGGMIGVFAPSEDKMRFRTAIDRVKDTKGKDLTPSRVCRSAVSSTQ